MPISASERLRRFHEVFSGNDSVLILINADPDAIASAMAISRLLWHKVAKISIGHINIIDRPDNLAMVRLLGVKMYYIDETPNNRFDRTVIVDSQPAHNELFAEFHPDVIIDHHPDTGIKAPFTDIRPKYGATASIMTEYLRAARIKPSAKLATGLFYAIKTDTSNFKRQTLIEDVRAFQFLFRHANPHLARKIEQAELRIDFLQYFQSALKDMHLRKHRVYAHLGPVSTPDVCVLIADFFMRVQSVTWSVISGTHDNRLVIVLRNDGIRKNAGTIAAKGFGQIGSAGGHKSMARAEIPLSALKKHVDYNDQSKLQFWIIRKIEHRA